VTDRTSCLAALDRSRVIREGEIAAALRYLQVMKERLRKGLVLVWVLIVVGIAGLAIWYVLRGGPAEDWSNRAQFASALLSFAILVPPVVVWGWRHRRAEVGISTKEQVDGAADLLAERTRPFWSDELVRRGIELPAPVRVQWQRATSEVTPPPDDLAVSPSRLTDPRSLPSGGDDPSGTAPLLSSGLVTQLHDQLYAHPQLRHGRLALIGGPGAGKTAAMILLLVEALRYREGIPDAKRADVPVPMLLSLGSWNPSSQGQGLRDWVTATIRRNHAYVTAAEFGPDAAAQLFNGGRIALFLDGLDEMPDMLRGQALERLTAEAAGLRVVITSRPEEFRATLGTGRQLPYTAVVELQPVDPQAAKEYLLEARSGLVGRSGKTSATICSPIRAVCCRGHSTHH
jgi:hypothetical protein